MKAFFSTIVVCILIANSTDAQDRAKYTALIDEAWALYESKDYLKSGQTYNAAFRSWGDKGMIGDRYNSACSWALAGEADSSFVQLFRIAEKGNYTNLNHISVDPDLESLYGDSRWDEVISLVKANKDKAEANLNKPLVAILDTIYQEDQKYRMQISEIEEKYGRQSEVMQALRRIKARQACGSNTNFSIPPFVPHSPQQLPHFQFHSLELHRQFRFRFRSLPVVCWHAHSLPPSLPCAALCRHQTLCQ